jgi:hypothetical protein
MPQHACFKLDRMTTKIRKKIGRFRTEAANTIEEGLTRYLRAADPSAAPFFYNKYTRRARRKQ